MTEHDDADWVHLESRIIVLELVIRTMLTRSMLDHAEPLDALSKYKEALWGCLEPMTRGSVVSELLWTETAAAFEHLFTATTQRLKNILDQQRSESDEKPDARDR